MSLISERALPHLARTQESTLKNCGEVPMTHPAFEKQATIKDEIIKLKSPAAVTVRRGWAP